MTNGETIKALRQKAMVSQKELAERAGVSSTTLSAWERGVYPMSDDNLEMMKAALAKELKKAEAREWRRKANEINTVLCESCRWWRWLDNSGYGAAGKFCAYLYYNRVRRGCPADENCTRYETRKEIESEIRKKNRKNFLGGRSR